MDFSSFQTVKSISFGIFTNDEIRSMSVLEITNTEILDTLGHPSPEGLHDLRLGMYAFSMHSFLIFKSNKYVLANVSI